MADIEQLKAFVKTRKKLFAMKWHVIEKRLGFSLHKNVKEFYSHTTCVESQGLACCMYLDPKVLVKPSGNVEYDSYLSPNGNTNDVDRFGNDVCYNLDILNNNDIHDSYDTIYYAFNNSKLKNCNIGRRALITKLERRCGTVWIFINNNTGKYEWAYFTDYETSFEDTPHGLIADDFNEFVNKLIKMWKNE